MEFSSIDKTIDVDTGEIRVSSEPVLLQSIALGSCIAMVVYERQLKIGGVAHIMLPGKCPSYKEKTKYTEDAIESLLDRVNRLGAKSGNLEISLVGGANVLQEGDIPDKVINSVLGYLKKIDLKVKYMRIGGIDRRSVFLDTSTGKVFYTESDNSRKILLTKIERM